MKNISQIALLLLFIACVGCKGAKIKDVRTDLKPDSFAKTDAIYIKAISADRAEFTGDKSDDSERVGEEKTMIRDLLARVLVEELKKKGFNAQLASGSKHEADVTVDGAVTKVEHGSAAARAWVGMGAGSSNMYITMRVYKGARNLIGDFDVVASSGGSGGFLAMGSFVEGHVRDGAKKTADYFSKHIQ